MDETDAFARVIRCAVLCCVWLLAELLAFLWPVERAPSAAQPASRSVEDAAGAVRRKVLEKMSIVETANRVEDNAM